MIHPLSENLALLLPQSGLLSSVLVKKKKAYLEMGVVPKPEGTVQPMTPEKGVSGSPHGGSDLAS